jgi:hypothetical protein
LVPRIPRVRQNKLELLITIIQMASVKCTSDKRTVYTISSQLQNTLLSVVVVIAVKCANAKDCLEQRSNDAD